MTSRLCPQAEPHTVHFLPLNGIRLPDMRPRAILIATLLLVVIVVAIIVGWATVGDRPGPLNTRAFFHSVDVKAGTSN